MTELEILEDAVRRLEPFRAHEFARRQPVALPGFQVWMVGKEDLILSKLAWAKPTRSELQLRDVRALLETGTEVDYLRRWAPDLSVSGLLEDHSVNDTSSEVALMVAKCYAGMLPGERVRIAAEMFDTARQLVLASFPAGLSPAEARRRLCRRFYGELAENAFSQPEVSIVLADAMK